MANEIGPIPAAGKIVVFNPDAPTQVRQVSGAGSPAWVELEDAVFAECAIALVAGGAFYFADLPAGLAAATGYVFALYDAAADDFSAASDVYEYFPAAEGGATAGEIVAALGGSTITYNGPVAATGEISIYQGDDYTGSKAITWVIANYSGVNVDGETLTFTLMTRAAYRRGGGSVDLEVNGAVVQDGTTVTITVPLSSAETAVLESSPPLDAQTYFAQGRTNTTKTTLVYAWCTVKQRVADAA